MPAPFNISIIEPDEYIQRRNILPVTSHAMFEASTSRFHPDGLFSEVIFGQIGSLDRLIRRGFMDLKTKIISPHLFKQLMSLKSYYKDIVAGKEYAIYDPELKDLVKTSKDDVDGETGYSFFVRCLPNLVFQETGSTKRHDKIALLDKYNDRIFMTRFIILPAGVRDVREENGRMAPEEINKIYLGLLSLTQAMPSQDTDDSVFDPIRYQIQMKVQQVYAYIANLIDGKGGYGQSKYAARSVVYSNRNVITASPVSRVVSPESPNKFSIDEVMVPLFQGMKGASPLIVNKLKTIFFEQTFGSQTVTIPLINPQTLGLEYHEVESSEIKKFTTSEGINDIINGFRNPNIHFEPVTVKIKNPSENTKTLTRLQGRYYLHLVYDDGKNIYPFRNLDDFLLFYSREKNYTTEGIENLKLIEGFYPQEVVILGSTALRAFGMVHYNQDIDILVSETEMEDIRANSNFEKQENGVYRHKDGTIDVYNDLILKENNMTFTEYKQKFSIQIDKYFFDKPSHLLEVYTKSNRPKDRGKIQFLKSIVPDLNNIRPLTYVEMCYMAAYAGLRDCYATATRHPILNLEGISIFKVHLVSTSPSRVVTLKRLQDGDDDMNVILPEYPILGSTVKTSMSVHPATLEKYDGKYDCHREVKYLPAA